MFRERLSALAVVPDDLTDPLLWRLALDVAAAHQPNERGDCRNLQCAGQRDKCAAACDARRAMTLARRPRPVVARQTPMALRDHRRAVADVGAPTSFRGWFTPMNCRTATKGRGRLAASQPPPLGAVG
ncbi:hypothetical protein [Micromonospora orduensis]|uniref:hypothetical protein n=1 Tax=Micromonospora orduensis TaxID=1420891 RepID=UPI001FCB2681|nr:hypothetical protein [Micromonospora orduensis]